MIPPRTSDFSIDIAKAHLLSLGKSPNAIASTLMLLGQPFSGELAFGKDPVSLWLTSKFEHRVAVYYTRIGFSELNSITLCREQILDGYVDAVLVAVHTWYTDDNRDERKFQPSLKPLNTFLYNYWRKKYRALLKSKL